MILYHVASISKIIVWIGILLITYTSINIYEDPAIAIGLWFIGLFIALWGISFYGFWIGQSFLRHNITKERLYKDSYKLSFLFGMYCMINVLLLILWNRNKIVWLLLFIGFIAIQINLFSVNKQHGKWW